MGSQTATFKIPYPLGTDRVMDGDNAMQAIAEKVDALLGPWQTFAPVWNAVSFSTTFMWRYARVGNTVHYQGSGLVSAVGAGTFQTLLPLAAQMGTLGANHSRPIGTWHGLRQGVGRQTGVALIGSPDGNTLQFAIQGGLVEIGRASCRESG